MKSIAAFLLLSLLAVVANAEVCPQVQLEIEGDVCVSADKFNRDFITVYKAMYNWLDWYDFWGYGSTMSLTKMAQTSMVYIVDEDVSTDKTESVVLSSNGGYGAIKGNTRRFLEVMEEGLPEEETQNHGDRDLIEGCYPPLLCKSMGWCCLFCPCKTRRNLRVDRKNAMIVFEEAAQVEEDAIAVITVEEDNSDNQDERALKSTAVYTSVCAWLQAQTLPGCLAASKIKCVHLGEFA